MNLVEVPIADGGVKFGETVVPVSREALSAAADAGDRTVTVGVRPEHFDVGSEGGLTIIVNVVEELGADGYVYGRTTEAEGGQDIVVRVGGRQVPEKGSTLRVVPRADEIHVFSTSSGERLSG